MIISILYDIDFDTLDDMPYDEVLILEENLSFLFKPIPKIYKSEIVVDKDQPLFLIDFNKLEFGAFIDIEFYLSKGNLNKSLPDILQVLFRRQLQAETNFVASILEPYHNYSTFRRSLFAPILFVDVWGSISKYLDFREKIFTTYEGMFTRKEETDEVDESRMTAEERKEIEKEKRIGKWGYELLLMKLANNDPLQIGQAMELPLTRAFNLLALMYELNFE